MSYTKSCVDGDFGDRAPRRSEPSNGYSLFSTSPNYGYNSRDTTARALEYPQNFGGGNFSWQPTVGPRADQRPEKSQGCGGNPSITSDHVDGAKEGPRAKKRPRPKTQHCVWGEQPQPVFVPKTYLTSYVTVSNPQGVPYPSGQNTAVHTQRVTHSGNSSTFVGDSEKIAAYVIGTVLATLTSIAFFLPPRQRGGWLQILIPIDIIYIICVLSKGIFSANR